MRRKWFSPKELVIALFAFTLVSCTSTPPTAPPDYSAAPPSIASGFHVENQETIEVDLPRAQFLAWREQTNLSEILTATEGMPSVEILLSCKGVSGVTWVIADE